jgi:hypothetical protein
LLRGVGIEKKIIDTWKENASKITHDPIDWKGREQVGESHDFRPSDRRRKSKYSPIFNKEWRYQNGGFPKVKRQINFVHHKYKHHPEKFPKMWRNLYNTSFQVRPNEKTSWHIGKFPARVGSRPNTFAYPDPRVQSYFKSQNRILSHFGLKDPNNYLQVGGTFDTNFHTFQRQSDNCKDLPPFTFERFSKVWKPILRECLPKLDLIELIPPEESDIDKVGLAPETYSGLRWEKFEKMRTKGQAATHAKEVAKEFFQKMKKKVVLSESLWSIGGRESREDDSLTEDKEVTSRGVHMPEVHEEILNFLWSRPIEKFFFDKGSGPIYLGHKFVHGGWRRLRKDLSKAVEVLEGDWKKFDSSLSEELMVIAIAIIRSVYPEEPWIDRNFIRIASQMIFKNYVTPGGYIIKIGSGMPSGSALTAVANSIVNFLILNRICFEHLGLNSADYKMAIAGDDFLVMFLKDTGFLGRSDWYESVSEFALKNIGTELKPNAKWTVPRPESIMDSPSFFKTVLWEGLPTIRPDHLYERLLSPNSMISKKWTAENFFLSFFDCPPAPFTHLYWAIDLYVIMTRANGHVVPINQVWRLMQGNFERVTLGLGPRLEMKEETKIRKPLRLMVSEGKRKDQDFRGVIRRFLTWDRVGKVFIGRRLMKRTLSENQRGLSRLR